MRGKSITHSWGGGAVIERGIYYFRDIERWVSVFVCVGEGVVPGVPLDLDGCHEEDLKREVFFHIFPLCSCLNL